MSEHTVCRHGTSNQFKCADCYLGMPPRDWYKLGPVQNPEPDEPASTLRAALSLHIFQKYRFQSAAAIAWGVSNAFVSKVLHGKSHPTQVMLDDAGIVVEMKWHRVAATEPPAATKQGRE